MAVTADTLAHNADDDDDANADADGSTTARGNEGSSKAPLEYARLLIELGEVPNFNTKNMRKTQNFGQCMSELLKCAFYQS
jgi:hypothetical protein